MVTDKISLKLATRIKQKYKQKRDPMSGIEPDSGGSLIISMEPLTKTNDETDCDNVTASNTSFDGNEGKTTQSTNQSLN